MKKPHRRLVKHSSGTLWHSSESILKGIRTVSSTDCFVRRVLEKKKKNPKREMEIVLKRVATWLDNRNGISHLPKTKSAFQTTIAKMCIVNGTNCKVITVSSYC